MIQEQLFNMADEGYGAFMAKLIPDGTAGRMLGCRTPALRKLAKTLSLDEPEVQQFLVTLPHTYFDENQLHAFLIARITDFPAALHAVEEFLPYVDNWATCDQLLPIAFRRQAEDLLPVIPEWLAAEHPYTVRFAIGMLMQHFLDDRFQPIYPAWVADVRSEAYYVKMEQAWYFATALAKQPEEILPWFTSHRLSDWVHRKAIQKCIESRRIPPETKAFLRSLR